jgi:GNAT superfamily N-acetyltransferase
MYELLAPDFERVMPLFAHISFHRPAIFTVLEGTQPGRVFVDRVTDPTAVVMISDFCYFSGSPETLDLEADVLQLLEREVMSNREHLLLFPFTDSWQMALQTILRSYEPKFYERSTFVLDVQTYRQLHTGWQQYIPAGFSLQRLNAGTALEVGGIPELWGTVENFRSKGFGFCLIDEAQPDENSGFASSAQTVFVGDCRAETGVDTRQAYRRRGLATIVCCAFIDHCLQSGINPEWGCVYNEASEKLAYKLGYGNKRNWPFMYIHTPEHLRQVEVN